MVTARAVAPLPRLLGWTIPLLRPGGRLIALKGESAEAEVVDAADAITQWHLQDVRVEQVGTDLLEIPTTVIIGARGAAD